MLISNFTYVLITHLPEIQKEDFFIIHTKYIKIQKKTFPNLVFAKHVASRGFTTIVFQVLYQSCKIRVWLWTRERELACLFEGKGKAILLQAWTGPEVSRRLGFLDFTTIGT
jgi:hypothetical protein